MKKSRARGRLDSKSKRPRGSGRNRAQLELQLENDPTLSDFSDEEEAHTVEAQRQVEEDPWAIPIYVAPDLNLPTRFTGDHQGWVFRRLFEEVESGCEKSYGDQRSERTILFNSTRGFRNELIP